jgi:hypothetical protein
VIVTIKPLTANDLCQHLPQWAEFLAGFRVPGLFPAFQIFLL